MMQTGPRINGDYADAADYDENGDRVGFADQVEGTRRVVLVAADQIHPRPVFWLWKGRLALGTLGLLAGREGLGKSTLAYWASARITRGELFGHYYGTPKAVLVCATEDSWEHTIVPRLIAAGADLGRVYRVDVISALDVHTGLMLPQDLHAVEHAAQQVDAALLLLDPLISRLGDLDTHRDAEVRQALEPLVTVADKTSMAILGLIHHNKGGSSDPLQLVMGSKAFTAVARSVHTVVPDPDDETDRRRLFGTPKNNLGRTDLPTFTFTIESHSIDTDEGIAWTGRLEWGEEETRSIYDVMRTAADSPEDRSAVGEAAEWLIDYVSLNGGTVASTDAKREGAKAGHSQDSLKRARRKLGLTIRSEGYPRVTYWEKPVAKAVGAGSEPKSEQVSRGESPTALTTPTEVEKPWSEQLEQLEQSERTTRARASPSSSGHGTAESLSGVVEGLGGSCDTCHRFICECESIP
jgi:hypothetical protein